MYYFFLPNRNRRSTTLRNILPLELLLDPALEEPNLRVNARIVRRSTPKSGAQYPSHPSVTEQWRSRIASANAWIRSRNAHADHRLPNATQVDSQPVAGISVEHGNVDELLNRGRRGVVPARNLTTFTVKRNVQCQLGKCHVRQGHFRREEVLCGADHGDVVLERERVVRRVDVDSGGRDPRSGKVQLQHTGHDADLVREVQGVLRGEHTAGRCKDVVDVQDDSTAEGVVGGCWDAYGDDGGKLAEDGVSTTGDERLERVVLIVPG